MFHVFWQVVSVQSEPLYDGPVYDDVLRNFPSETSNTVLSRRIQICIPLRQIFTFFFKYLQRSACADMKARSLEGTLLTT